jgi:predicted MFS family arabinose efflux permease
MGISEAFYIPAALAMITDFHTGSTRSRAVGVHQAGIYLGQILGSFAGYVAESPDLGWRWMFHTCGMVGVIYALPLLWLLRNPARHSVDSAPKKPAFAGLSGLLSDRNYVLLVLYFTLPAIAGWIVRDWMPEILRERFSLGQGRAGVSAILFVQIASIVGVIVGGSLADRWMQHSQRGRIFTSAIGMMMFLPALFLIGNSWTLSVAIVGLVIFGVGWGFFDCNNMPILCQIARPESRATGYGIMNLVSISCGGFGDWVFGWLQDQGIPINATFGVFAGVALLSVVIVLLIRPKPDREVASGTN